MSERAKILGQMCFDENLVAMHVNAVDDQDAIDQVAKVMLREGMVKDSYPDAVKAREKVYATGLELLDIGIAIPHTDPEHVIQPAIALGILDHPVQFVGMGEPDKRVNVEIIFMHSILEPHSQLTILQKLMKVFQTEGKLTTLKNAKDAKEAAALLSTYLND